MEVRDKLKKLELEIVEKEEIIREKENILNKLEENVKVSRAPAEKDGLVVHQGEQHLEGEGERGEIDSDHPKLLRLRSVQDQAREELRRLEFLQSQETHEENSHLRDKIKHLEALLEDMAASNQDVIGRTSIFSWIKQLKQQALFMSVRHTPSVKVTICMDIRVLFL